ncbi:fasciclin domain-containing protein [Panacibacter ginsenosidivorans]|uniref:Fasciclin domain-containing protein n=1 Tax=Panacibacter ginsenosidivorans TaxID=1813871 RepID=A0A5B8VE18_9BACT|nr:fasciclin domain-containing protein [Panacibacter ginsenosidivorans]QEC69572.1 fasciclin domain-containing protein [Panacibacter ginsenosidivorans]
MRASIILKNLFLTAFVPFVMASCNSNDDTPQPQPTDPTIAEIAASDTSFSFLLAAATKAGLVDELSAPGALTVFAPTNNAFRAAGFPTQTSVEAADATTLAGILTYHIISGKVLAADVPAGPNAAVTVLSGGTVYTTSNSLGVFVNGVKVVTADIAASNGVVHVIGKVLIPPSGNIVETAVANPDFSYLVAAVLRASEGTTDVAGVLSGTDPLTVFAPTNQAFINAGFATIADIQAADPDVLTSILTYHVVNGRVFSSDLTDGATPSTLNGGTVTIDLGATATVKGNTNTTASNIVATDIVTTNGVIHVIDQVLLP